MHYSAQITEHFQKASLLCVLICLHLKVRNTVLSLFIYKCVNALKCEITLLKMRSLLKNVFLLAVHQRLKLGRYLFLSTAIHVIRQCTDLIDIHGIF